MNIRQDSQTGRSQQVRGQGTKPPGFGMPDAGLRTSGHASPTSSVPRASGSAGLRGRMWTVGAGISFAIAMSWTLPQIVQVEAEQGLMGCGKAMLAQLNLGWPLGEGDEEGMRTACSKWTTVSSTQFGGVKTHLSPRKVGVGEEPRQTLRSVAPLSKEGMPLADLLSILLGPQSVHAENVSSGPALTGSSKVSGSESPKPSAEPIQGPALIVPEEMVAMFQQRKQELERREDIARTAEGRVTILKAEVEQILNKIEAVEQRRLDHEKAAVGQQASQREHASDLRKQQLGQLAKMYESMPAEEAAARIERMPDRKALEILRLLKSKSAGAILAQVKVDRAAKLTEELLTAP